MTNGHSHGTSTRSPLKAMATLYLSTVLNRERLKIHIAFTTLSAMLMSGMWLHILYSAETALSTITLAFVHVHIIMGSIYLASGSYSVLFHKSKSLPRQLALALIIIATFTGASFAIDAWVNPLLFHWTCDTVCMEHYAHYDTIVQTYGDSHRQGGFINWINTSVIALAFFLLAWSYEALRLRTIDTSKKLREKELNEQNLRLSISQAELLALQAKINPHFLFNTLNSITSLIPIDPHKAGLALQILRRLFQLSLQKEGAITTLKDSIEQAEAYLSLEKLRLGERLSYSFHIVGNPESIHFPDLVLQPLVENSIKHGISPKISGGSIQISASIGEQTTTIIVDDDGMGFCSTSDHGTGHGLANIKERLKLLFGQEASMEVSSNNGFTVTITIPTRSSL